MADTSTERHPFRFLFKFLLFIGALAAVTKVVASKKKEYYGLTESEARAKFEAKLGPRIGEEKASEIADQVIPRLKDSGVIKPDPMEQVVNDAKDVASEAVDKVQDAAGAARNSMKDAAEKIEEKLD
ncbi:MAG TPA: hypothetical protein VLS86_08390 [Acidimicrobiia bacterium]|nr:hypothetical protein [Acidimicrobiia bacterium]